MRKAGGITGLEPKFPKGNGIHSSQRPAFRWDWQSFGSGVRAGCTLGVGLDHGAEERSGVWLSSFFHSPFIFYYHSASLWKFLLKQKKDSWLLAIRHKNKLVTSYTGNKPDLREEFKNGIVRASFLDLLEKCLGEQWLFSDPCSLSSSCFQLTLPVFLLSNYVAVDANQREWEKAVEIGEANCFKFFVLLLVLYTFLLLSCLPSLSPFLWTLWWGTNF